ncbi:MAG TPA: fumarylacetoacetate hydrolase family protein [Jatrophihabitans sp.]|jgi:fumarylacetoacetase|uniref:fumarylacetoacetate hydrolase family protein n=1 Tax=Jatrophihabitans sp. TaxID=1932789 RepID=UPI002E0AC25E|nr:fumarylacetoacetate hydrolase family protein [Jatrophihabitans sp.]
MGWGIGNLPYGSVVGPDGRRFAAVRFGDAVLELARVDADLFAAGGLDRFLAAGPATWSRVRAEVVDTLTADRHPLVPLADVTPVLPFAIGDYVDFFASEHHAANCGRIFRPGNTDPLSANWRHQPIGYDGRAGSVVVSGTDIARPSGQFPGDDGPIGFAPTRRLDLEAEVAFVVGPPGTRIAVAEADEHVFGVCLLNDWSARDIQAFESAPLGPFLGKSFATSLAAWITPLEALAAARTRVPQDPEPLPHLRETGAHGLRLDLAVSINGQVVARPEFGSMYWSYAQMLAHLTSNGAAVRTGDVFASGTVSGPARGQRGCLLELTWNGAEPIELGDGTSRTWLEDGDEVVVSAHAGDITLGEVAGRITRG